jgi:acyl-CoA thioesterase I
MSGACILFFGDDVIAGSGDRSHRGIVGRLLTTATEAGLDVAAYNLGVIGDTSVGVLRRWRKEASPRVHEHPGWQPVFSFGANDVARLDVATSLQAMQKIAVRTREQGLVPLVIGPPPWGGVLRRDGVVALSQRFADMCEQHEVAYCETAATLCTSAAWNAGLDGERLGSGAYDELGRVVRDNWLTWLTRRSR